MAWRYRWLLWSFVRRDMRDRYVGSLAGGLWAVVHPLALLAIYAFVFTSVFQVRLPQDAGGSFVAFLAVTLWPWLMFAEGVTRGMGSVRANEGLVRKVAFPHRLLVYSSVASSYALHFVGYIAVLLAVNFFVQPLHLFRLPIALVVMAALALATVGVAAFLAAVQALVRDAEQVVAVLLALLFYATPVLYPMSLVPERVRPLIAANPLAAVVERLREILLHGAGPAWQDAGMLVVGGIVCALGLWFFERLSPFFEDFL